MKNCDEMVNSLLERREEYVAEQRRKRKVVTRTITSMCCVCMVALLGFGAWKGGVFDTAPQTTQDALYPGIKDNFDESKGESLNNPTANNKIIIHQIDEMSEDRYKINISIKPDDFVVMDKGELNKYYGTNIFPAVPDDVQEWEDQHFGIYRENSGTGKVYWDSQVLNYSNEDFSRTVNVEIDKNSLPLCDYLFFDETEEKSVINNIEVAIGQNSNGYYYAQFMYQNVGFQIVAGGLTQDEFVAVISSLIQ